MDLEVSVVIPTLNSAKTLRACLGPLKGRHVETIVVDDCSTDSTQEIARDLGATVVEIRKRSAAAARNAGVDNSTGDIIAFTDSDCVPAPDWLDSICAAFESEHDADIVGGSVIYREDSLFRRAYSMMYQLTDAKSLADNSFMLPGMNLSVRRKVFDVLRFDETLPGALCDDVDFLIRALSLGANIRYHPGIRVTHLNPANFRSFVRQELRHGMGDAVFRRRHPEVGGVYETDFSDWVVESVRNLRGHVELILREAGATTTVTVLAALLNYTRHAAGGLGRIKARRLAVA